MVRLLLLRRRPLPERTAETVLDHGGSYKEVIMTTGVR
jgi:hypothetical protein